MVRKQEIRMRSRRVQRLSLVLVLATQLWHQMYLDDSLADMPSTVGVKSLANGRETVKTGQPAAAGLVE